MSITLLGIVRHCFPPRPVISASPNVFANGIAVSRIGDPYPTHCVTGDTLILINDDYYVKIKDLVDLPLSDKFVLSRLDNGEIIRSEIVNAFWTKNTTELILLEFDNGSVLQCTPDHLIQLKSGEYKAAGELTENDEL